MLREIDNFFAQKEEPAASCLLYLRKMICNLSDDITEEWKYKMPFYYYKKRMLCYLWVNKKTGLPYIGIVDGNKLDHPDLIQEKRSRMKILPINPEEDIPVKTITTILEQAIALHK